MSGEHHWLTTDEVAARLNVKRETVYAYVSRGRLTSVRSNTGRGSLFDPRAIDRLAAQSRTVSKAVDTATSSDGLASVQGGVLYYRRLSAEQLANESTFEDVAEFMWKSDRERRPDWECDRAVVQICRRMLKQLPDDGLPIGQLHLITSVIGAVTPPEIDTNSEVVRATARRLLMTMIMALPELSQPVGGLKDGKNPDVPALLWSRLCYQQPTPMQLRAFAVAMILSVDHEVASATSIVQAAARSSVDPVSLIRLGLCVGTGPLRGPAGLKIEDFLHSIGSLSDVPAALSRQLRRGEPVPGFGHVVYPNGDSRAAQILEHLRTAFASSERLAIVDEVIRVQLRRGLPPPNAGFAICALSYAAEMIPGASEVIFVLSRTAGWMAHALEQYPATAAAGLADVPLRRHTA